MIPLISGSRSPFLFLAGLDFVCIGHFLFFLHALVLLLLINLSFWFGFLGWCSSFFYLLQFDRYWGHFFSWNWDWSGMLLLEAEQSFCCFNLLLVLLLLLLSVLVESNRLPNHFGYELLLFGSLLRWRFGLYFLTREWQITAKVELRCIFRWL